MNNTDTAQRLTRRLALGLLTAAVSISVIGRFLITSPLWLDEALSVNIARLDVQGILRALRSDGHPPLYYLMLHGWIELFGDGDRAVRTLSGIISLATIPLAYAVGKQIDGRRMGYSMALVIAISPYVFRYGSETRMYSLVIAEVLLAYLMLGSARANPRVRTLAGVSISIGLLLWTHYWSIWLVIAIATVTFVDAVTARRRGDRVGVSSAAKILGAIAVGAATFIPWLPTLLYQSAHTATPWSEGFRITGVVIVSLTEFAGGAFSEAQLGMVFLVVLALIGVFGVGVGPRKIMLGVAPRPLSRRPLVMLGGTVLVASVAGLMSGTGFAPRYASVFFPFFAVLVALGLQQFHDGVARDVVLVVLAVTALAGVLFVARLDRTQAGRAVEVVEAGATSGVVVVCPDQLGPSVGRLLDRDRYDVFTYPRFEAPELVDWVDYEKRNERNDPIQFAEDVLKRAEGRPLFLVYRDDLLTLEGQCQKVLDAIAAVRPSQLIMIPEPDDYYESMAVARFSAQ